MNRTREAISIGVLLLMAGVLAVAGCKPRPGRTPDGRVTPSPAASASPAAAPTSQPVGYVPPATFPPAGDNDAKRLYLVQSGGRFGYVDCKGRVAIAPQFSQARRFEGRFAAAGEDGNWGVIDQSGDWVIPPQFAWPIVFHEDRAPIRGLGVGPAQCDYLGPDGQVPSRARFSDCRRFSDRLGAAQRGGRWGFVNNRGEWIVEPMYDEVRGFSDGLAAVWTGGRMGYIDRKGAGAIAPKYEIPPADAAPCDFSEGLAAVREGAAWGYIDRTGATAIAAAFEAARPFSESLAAVRVGGKWGFIDRGGKRVIEPAYASVDPPAEEDEPYEGGFRGGLAAVADAAGNWGYINPQGGVVVPLRYRKAGPFRGPLAQIQTDAGTGYIDKTGREVVKPMK